MMIVVVVVVVGNGIWKEQTRNGWYEFHQGVAILPDRRHEQFLL